LRWCSGLIDVAKLRLPVLLDRRRATGQSAVSGLRRLRFDSFMILISPIIQLISLIPTILSPLFRLLAGELGVLPVAAALAASYAGVAIFGAALSKAAGYDTRRMARGVLMFPLFMASWLPILAAAFFRRTSSWSEMKRAAALSSIDENRRRPASRAPGARGAHSSVYFFLSR
jgi:hypothetical protein